MRIGSNIPDLQVVSTARPGAASAAAGQARQVSPDESASDPQDVVSVSVLTSQALQTPEIRQDQVDSLEQSVLSGEYRLDPGQIASAMLDF
jgi:flagellar biosynthesis anti-sigma factor FlgM